MEAATGPAKPPEPLGQSLLGLRTVAIVASFGLALLTYKVEKVPSHHLAEIPGLAAVAIAGYQLLSFVDRLVSGSWRRVPTRLMLRALAIALALAGAGVMGLLMPEAVPFVGIASLMLLVVALCYASNEGDISTALTEAGGLSGTARWRELPIWPGQTLGGVTEKCRGAVVGGWIAELLSGDPAHPLTPITQIAEGAIAGTLVVFTLTALIGLFGLIEASTDSQPLPTPPTHGAVKHPYSRLPANLARRPAGGVGPRPGASPLTGSWDENCLSLPGAGGPSWSKQGLYDFYLGPGGLGASGGGCTGLVYEPSWAGGGFVYTLGTLPNHPAPMSLAVDSRKFGPALFTDAAVAPLLELIDDHTVFGGSGVIPAGNGQGYAVYAPNSTMILIRPQIHVTGTSRPVNFTLLLPPVAASWFAAVQRTGSWLWPRRPTRGKDGSEIFELARLGFGSNFVGRIIYQPRTGVAVLELHGASNAAFSRGEYISRDDLSHYAASAQ